MNIALNNEHYEYDVRSLVQSFYPGANALIKSLDAFREEGIEADIEITITNGEAEVAYKGEPPLLMMGGDCTTKEYKRAFKCFLYQTLSEHTGKKLPWGALTGIRPTKIAMDLINHRVPDERVLGILKENYLVSDEKAELCLEIAKREKSILDTLTPEKGISIYIGIPFCPSTCLYCSFTSYPVRQYEKRMDEYLEALFKEIDYVRDELSGYTIDTIYIGGGTPTSLNPERLERLLSKLDETFDLPALKEFTVEAGRADSITREKLEVIRKYHANRISINPQTMKDETLKLIGRHHNSAQVVEAFHMARELGFDNINMDLILGLPGETAKDVTDTMEKLKELDPDNITVHSLAIKRASKLGDFIRENGYDQLNNTDETMQIASQAARSLSMSPYYLYRQKNMSGNFENTGFAKEGKNGIYNILIMEEVQTIVALGAGTVTKRVIQEDGVDGSCRIERCDNVKDVALYISKIDEMIDRKRVLFAD